MGRGGATTIQRRGQAHTAQYRILSLPLVPRHGAGVVRGRGNRFVDERVLHQYQGGPGRTS